ncbi:hypothetical protein J1N35_005461 [Gossypium stocksii]|uniref:Uncharacterized protein n=1 Tax=Gossypium stocksii TaxID=47602 RepID=A0A9D4AJA3_9ROSI|nr:hypothetical protein J1N35_005461 [Gossypium stocksii]
MLFTLQLLIGGKVSLLPPSRSACPNYPQIIILDFISSCQKLVHWELQKGKQIGEWWKQVIAKVHIVRNGIIELNNFRIYLVKLKSTASCKHCLCFSISWSLLQPTDH